MGQDGGRHAGGAAGGGEARAARGLEEPRIGDRHGPAVAPHPQPGLKRLIDLVGAGAGLVLALPLFAACALSVMLTSKGPVLFRQLRMGEGGFPFVMFKFRTMVVDAEDRLNSDERLQARYRENGFKVPRGEDPRITAVGHFLRFTHLDELPQLWNVLRGDLSLVGPRPITLEELEKHPQDAERFLSMRPGIFGVWTALGRRRPPYPERRAVELRYLEERSLAFDLSILLRSIPVLLRGQGEQ